MKNYNFKLLIVAMTVLIPLNSCGIYSFTGVAITAETMSIQPFYNDADNGPPNLAQTFTNKITDYYQSNTNLALLQEDGELQLEGAITGYKIAPVSPTAARGEFDETASLTRLTITVKATYINTKDETFNFENKTFSWYEDFDNNQSLTSIEDQLIENIYDIIILDIFNSSVANW